MGFWENMNKRAKKLSLWDIKLAGLAGVAIGFVIAKLFPRLMDLSVWWFVALYLIFIVKPFYVVWIKK